MVASITLNHHEKYDGSGYPNGIKGEDIPLSARITSIADVYDALRSRRPYKSEWTHKEAVTEITKNSGTHFDPVIIDTFIGLADIFENVFMELKD